MTTHNAHGFTAEQLEKLGNAIIYLTKGNPLPKTNVLKLIYILDELSIKKFGIPFFNLNYKVWKFGPVEPNLYYEFTNQPFLMKEHVQLVHSSDANGIPYTLVEGTGEFNDDEFSDNDLVLLEQVKKKWAKHSTRILVNITHAKNAPWYISAHKSGHLDCLVNGRVNTTNVDVDTSIVIADDEIKQKIYADYLEQFGNPRHTQC